MKLKYSVIILAIVCFISRNVFSQSLAGITGKPDTSYSLYNAFISTKKTHPEAGLVDELNPGSYTVKKDIVYCAAGKRNLLLDAFYPKPGNAAKRIAVIIIHGGGWRTGNRTMHYPLAQHLASRGYACFTPEYRLSTEALYPAAVYDIKAAIRWVRQHAEEFNIDTAKIAVAGHSAGGELAAFMGATNGKPEFEGSLCSIKSLSNVNAVIDIDGILAFIHPESGEGDDSKRTSAATYWFGYSKTENPGLWKQASPLTHAGSHTPPVLFLNSSAARMHAGREDFISVLNQYHIYSEVKTFEGSPHSFCLFHPWFEPTVNHIDGFLKKVF
jgi:acetyl esterase/lipase